MLAQHVSTDHGGMNRDGVGGERVATVCSFRHFASETCPVILSSSLLEDLNMKVVHKSLSTSYLKSLSDLVHRQGSDVFPVNGELMKTPGTCKCGSIALK